MGDNTVLRPKEQQIFDLGDRATFEEIRALGLDPTGRLTGTGLNGVVYGKPANGVRLAAIYAGEKRCPKRGEWFLSGAEIHAYRAQNDLGTVYHIAKLVAVETKTVVMETIISQ